MEEQVLHVSIEDFLRLNLDGKSYQDKLFLLELKGDGHKKPKISEDTAIRLDAFSIFLVRKGEVDVTIDNTTYHLSDNFLLDIMDLHVIRGMHFSSDFQGYHLIIERNLFGEIMLNSRRMPAAYIASRLSRPVLKLSEEDGELLENCFHRIEQNIDRTKHAWQRDLVLNELRGFCLEMNNIIYQANREQVNLNPSNKDLLLFLFIQLLNNHCKEEHSVTFYARELCITPEYLSRILKSFSGKTVNKWIAEALMREAEIYLRNPDFTIQQISDMLNFSDQSSFGKFFKKHKGVSPLQYRTNVIVDS